MVFATRSVPGCERRYKYDQRRSLNSPRVPHLKLSEKYPPSRLHFTDAIDYYSHMLPDPTKEQLQQLRAQAVKNNDKYTVLSVDRALRGDPTDMLACAMCLPLAGAVT